MDSVAPEDLRIFRSFYHTFHITLISTLQPQWPPFCSQTDTYFPISDNLDLLVLLLGFLPLTLCMTADLVKVDTKSRNN